MSETKIAKIYDGLVRRGCIRNIEHCAVNVTFRAIECRATADIYVRPNPENSKHKICNKGEKVFFIGNESDPRAGNEKYESPFLFFGVRGRHSWKDKDFIDSNVAEKREATFFCVCDKKGKDVDGNCYYCAKFEGYDKPVWVHERFAVQDIYASTSNLHQKHLVPVCPSEISQTSLS